MLNVKGVKDTRQVQSIALQSRLKIPLLFGLDVIHGYKTVFPIPLAEAASWDMELLEQSAHIAAKEAAAAGIHWTFAPMVDIARDPRWGRIMEGAGEDTYLGSLAARARVKGFQGTLGSTDAVLACAKHFAGYGAATAGRDYYAVDMSNQMLWETYLPPFKAAVDAGVATFMNSFNTLNGIPATGNVYLQRDILKGKWGFKGFTVSDWGSIGEMVTHGYAENDTIAALRAITAGSDMDMESRAYLKTLGTLVKQKKVSMALVDDAVKRILYLKYKLGLFDDPYKFSDEKREKQVLNDTSHKLIARFCAERSIVLLKNERNTLPIQSTVKTIALIGPLIDARADLDGSWAVQPVDTAAIVTFVQGLKNRYGNHVKFLTAKGCDVTGASMAGFDEAVNIAKQADLVLMAIGESGSMSGEAKSRSDIHVPGVQEQLFAKVKATGKPVVAVIMAGRPLILDSIADKADAILYAWWLGSESGNAIASVLSGNYNPAGKLPVSIPRNVGQLPFTYAQLNTGRPVMEDQNTTYKSAYIDVANSPQYAFGYGLSYTTFAYSDLKLSRSFMSATDTLKVSFTLTNTGDYAGEEIAQLYIRDRVASVARPIKELKGFIKKKLERGESETLTFAITKESLSFYNSQLNWVVEPGEFDIMIGSASDKILLRDKIFVK
ncbi:glycoside hydrolase family 3 N-terminal domain-containing protein [Mucilaginibacter gracilis]|uniref:glycoside hydrolase family 3 N-terminal domain-containing protein n=1 Tax=Mucilaginibacter gracilis TaxID=423350 RepID=UPI001FE37544|nr:glycoside hydrolase family 3 N-terminal domain-containing protein [Mucilaginibacter gracilis]